MQDLFDLTLGSGLAGVTSGDKAGKTDCWGGEGSLSGSEEQTYELDPQNLLRYSNQNPEISEPEYLDIPSKISKSQCIRTKDRVFWGRGRQADQ